ncbi:MAG: hypothetical protein EA396_04575 [Anaerolineaceae bacterium]|nr:MAG: hypothetical protein EA396_04575 [Anaerolineaceae bacterium]
MKFLRRLTIFSTLIVISIVAAACGGGGDDGDPEAVAQQAFEALMTFDFDTALPLLCAEQRTILEAQLEGSGDMMAEMQAMMGEAEFDMSNVTYTVSDRTDDSATVTIGGEVTISAMGQEFTEPAAGEGTPETLEMVVEDGDWRVCGDLGFDDFGF